MVKLLSFVPPAGSSPLVGVVSSDEQSVSVLHHPGTGTPYSDFFDVFEEWQTLSTYLNRASPANLREHPSITGETFAIGDITFAAPLPGRDVLAVGKNYACHAHEFSQSGYDASDETIVPEIPVIFTKRASSIVAHGSQIYPHPEMTSTLDYEGELGVIIGKAGARISKEDAMDYVWGWTIVNDVTARERQRDHKQFFIGKSLDTFCPVGPYLVPKESLDATAVNIETRVNGARRQFSNTSKMIFDVPTLIETISGGITLQPGDLIATGTPAGVAFGLPEPAFLKPGDVVEVTVEGIGTLSNTIAPADSAYPAVKPIHISSVKASSSTSPTPFTTLPDAALRPLPNGKSYHVELAGKQDGPALLFIHGLGGNLNFFQALARDPSISKTYKLILLDWEGHGLTPLRAGAEVSPPSIESIVADLVAVLDSLKVKRVSLVGHSMGGLIANTLAALHPERLDALALLGPVKALGQPGKDAMQARAATVREKGMFAVADTICDVGLSEKTKTTNPLAVSFTRASLMSTSAEGYARACLALAAARDPDYAAIRCPTLLIGGAEDKTSPPSTIDSLAGLIKGAKKVTLQDVGHWHAIEDHEAVARRIKEFLPGE